MECETSSAFVPVGVLEIHHKGTLFTMDDSGDTRLQWDRRNIKQIEDAQKRFDELKAKKYVAYSVNAKGDQGEVIDNFDPKLERIIMAPPMVGG